MHSPSKISLIFFLTFLISICCLFYYNYDIPMIIVWFTTGALGILIIFLLIKFLSLTWISPPIIYLIILWVFHFGLLFPASFSNFILGEIDSSYAWVFHPYTCQALIISLIFMASYGIGLLVAFVHRKHFLNISSNLKNEEIIYAGLIIIAMGVVIYLFGLVQYGANVLLDNYNNFYPFHSTFSYSIYFIAMGILFQISGGQKIKIVLLFTVTIFTPFALLLLFAGARTAPLFSVVCIFSVLSLRGFVIPKKFVIFIFIGTLILIGTTRELRQYGLESTYNNKHFEIQAPMTGLAELGGSLKPVFASIDYINKRGNYFFGETYVFPFIRQLQLFEGNRGTRFSDERFIAARINFLYGSIGFSTVAEAFLNGGILGVIFFSFVLGIIFGRLYIKSPTPYSLTILSIFMVPFFVNIRNSFIFVPAWLFYGLLFVLIAKSIKYFINFLPFRVGSK